MDRPDLPAEIFAAVTETLALWLARGWTPVAADVSAWSAAHWRAAQWVAYWQAATPLWVEALHEANIPASQYPAGIVEVAALSRARTESMLSELQALIAGLRAKGVELAPLKGARVAPFYYQPMTLRALGDIDVLVRPADLPRASAWLEAHAYTFYSRSSEDIVYLHGTRASEAWHPDNVRPLELHFRVREEFGGAGLTWDMSDALWQSATKRPYLQTETYLIAPALLLCHLCAHTSSDMFIRRGKLQQLADIAHVAGTLTRDDWQRFMRQIPAARARFVIPALALTARYYFDLIPADVLSALREPLTPRLRAWCDGATLAAVSESNLEARDGIGLPLARLLATSHRETGRAVLRSLLPPRWNLVKRYPRLAASPFYPICYLLLNVDRGRQITRRLLRPGAAYNIRHE